MQIVVVIVYALFLSTLSLRRATSLVSAFIDYAAYFYPRSPCGERQDTNNGANANLDFYPRSPCGERLRLCRLSLITLPISIHALLAESDRTPTTVLTLIWISIHALLAESDFACVGFH